MDFDSSVPNKSKMRERKSMHFPKPNFKGLDQENYKNASLEQINEESLSQPKLKKQNKSEANVDKKREKNIKNSESMRSKPKEKGVCKSVMDKQSRDRKAKGKNIEIIVDEQDSEDESDNDQDRTKKNSRPDRNTIKSTISPSKNRNKLKQSNLESNYPEDKKKLGYDERFRRFIDSKPKIRPTKRPPKLPRFKKESSEDEKENSLDLNSF